MHPPTFPPSPLPTLSFSHLPTISPPHPLILSPSHLLPPHLPPSPPFCVQIFLR